MYECLDCTYVCVPCVCLGPKEVKEDADSLGTGVTDSHELPCVTENQITVLWKSRKFSKLLSISPALARCFLIKEQRLFDVGERFFNR